MSADCDALPPEMRRRIDDLFAHHTPIHSQFKVGFTANDKEDSGYFGYCLDKLRGAATFLGEDPSGGQP
jgi:hypothetical protein